MKADENNSHRIWIFYALPLIVAAYLFGQCLYVMLSRVFYPYELEWIEGGMFQSVTRIVDGLPLYSSPNMEYVPSLYAPLYFYVSAASVWLFGKGLPALRLVSLLASFCAAGMVSASVWQLTRSKLATLLALLCWGAMYRYSGTYYDLARVDSLWAFFLTAAVWAFVFFSVQKKIHWLYVGLVSLVMAVFTKQTTLVLLPFFLLAIWCWSVFRVAFMSGMVLMFLVGAVGLCLQWQSGGWFYFYTMEMGRSHHFNAGLPMNFLHGDMLTSLPVYLFFCAIFIFCQCRYRKEMFAWFSLFSGYFIMSMLARWYSGGVINVLIPFHQLIVIMAVGGFWKSLQAAKKMRQAWTRYGLQFFVSLLFSLNVALGWFNPGYMLPSVLDRACGDTLVAGIAKAHDSRVCISRHPYLAILAGKETCAHEAFAVDVMNGSDTGLAKAMVDDIRQKLLDGSYGLMLLDNDAQFNGYGVPWRNLPYTATNIDACPADAFFPKVSGQRPRHILQYNGKGIEDLRKPVR